MEKKGNYFIAKSENLCKFAVQYSFGDIAPLHISSIAIWITTSEKNRAIIIKLRVVPYGAGFLIFDYGLWWAKIAYDGSLRFCFMKNNKPNNN